MDFCLIMAGGKGTRFWPLSRARKPKQLLSIVSEKTLLEETIDRIKPLIPLERVILVTTKEQAAGIRRVLPKLPRKNILVEPLGRNTAACIGWGIQVIARRDPFGTVAVLPADHHIPDQDIFVDTLKRALSVARSLHHPVTLGIRPTFPSTGYGYIRKGDSVRGVAHVFRLRSFHEKPSFEKAREYLSRGYFWNSGMFVWTVPVIQEAFRKYLPEHAALLEKIRKSPGKLSKLYPQFPSISIDYGIMEKLKTAYVVEALFRWNDIGSWESLRDFWPEDEWQNTSRREIVALDARNNLVEAPNKKIVALLGVKNLTVIDTPDALLVADKNRLQEVRQIVELLGKKGKKEIL
jgi:mannose-1-phosphate guanylyltransferase